MKEIIRKEIEKKVMEEYKVAMNWISGDHFRCYKMMIDVSDGDIWVDVFLSENEWKVYHDDTVMSLHSEWYNPGASGYIEDAISKLEEAGWIIK